MSDSLRKAEIDFEHFLVEKGLRLTLERRRVVDEALSTPQSFTVDELWSRISQQGVVVSRATVYRTVKLMAEAGALKAVDTGSGTVAYLAHFSRKTTLAELICTDCGRIEAIEAPFMEWYARAAAQKIGLEPIESRLQIKGSCTRRQLGACPHKAATA